MESKIVPILLEDSEIYSVLLLQFKDIPVAEELLDRHRRENLTYSIDTFSEFLGENEIWHKMCEVERWYF